MPRKAPLFRGPGSTVARWQIATEIGWLTIEGHPHQQGQWCLMFEGGVYGAFATPARVASAVYNGITGCDQVDAVAPLVPSSALAAWSTQSAKANRG